MNFDHLFFFFSLAPLKSTRSAIGGILRAAMSTAAKKGINIRTNLFAAVDQWETIPCSTSQTASAFISAFHSLFDPLAAYIKTIVDLD